MAMFDTKARHPSHPVGGVDDEGGRVILAVVVTAFDGVALGVEQVLAIEDENHGHGDEGYAHLEQLQPGRRGG